MSVLYTGLMSSAYQRHMALALVSRVVLIVRSLADSHVRSALFATRMLTLSHASLPFH